uniref:ribonuclease H n=1 Tax=Xiphophorus maculatus TaxID=8083 RepID=A0A3B5R4E0_XIPMA
MTVHGQPVTFLCDSGACKTCVKDSVGLKSSNTPIFVKSANGQTSQEWMSHSTDICDPQTGKRLHAPVVISPSCPINLLGRDLIGKLGIAIFPTKGGMKAKNSTVLLFQSDEDDLQTLPVSLWSTGPTDVGLITIVEPVTITPKSQCRPRIKQYPLKPDAQEGIKPVVQDLLDAGIIRLCPDSPCNTPIFPVQKADGKNWRMIQDLRAVNAAVQTRAPNVPDPHTLLNSLDPESKFFTVIDLSNAFLSIPVHPDSQYWFAFTFEGKKYTYTRLPQGFADSPTIFTQAVMTCLESFTPQNGSQILVYVDDLLIASKSKAACKADSLQLLHHLASTGNKVSKSKLQTFVFTGPPGGETRRLGFHQGH